MSAKQQLLDAAVSGDVPSVKTLLEGGVDPTCHDSEGISALMKACENGHMDVVVALLQGGAPWNQQDHEGYCAGQCR